jgi:C1A family cysteine protease
LGPGERLGKKVTKPIRCLTASLLLLLIAPPLLALDVADINQAIRDKGANWEAGETSMSKLSAEELSRRLPQPPGGSPKASVRRFQSSPQAAAADLPARIDWRNVDGHSYVTSVKDQEQCGACWAFASTAALESRILITSRTPDTDLNLSEQSMVSCEEDQYGCGGGYLDYAVEFLRTTGIPLESCYPFTSGNGITGACGGCADWQQNTYRITAFENVATSVEAMKSAIVKYGPLFAAMTIYQDFLSYKSGVYTHVTGTVVAGHAVTIVGYDDAEQCWIAKNSMGPDWGENGFFKIRAGTNEVGIESEAYDMIYATVPGFSFVLTPAGADFGTLTLPDQPSRTLSFTITNNGSAPLTQPSYRATNANYSVSPPSISTIPSAASADIQVTYTAKAGKTPDTGELQVASGGVTRSSSLSAQTNTRPAQPVNLGPSNGSAALLPVTLSASAFVDADGEAQGASQWIIRNASDNSVYTGPFDADSRTSFTVPSGVLQAGTEYYWQVIYRDERGALSAASAPTSFTATRPASGGGGCFIATAAFGTPMAGQVAILRQFRDRYLLTNYTGQKFVAWYYRHGPAAAHYIASKPLAKATVRVALYPLIGFSLLLFSGYLPFVIPGVLLTAFLVFRFRPKKSLDF